MSPGLITHRSGPGEEGPEAPSANLLGSPPTRGGQGEAARSPFSMTPRALGSRASRGPSGTSSEDPPEAVQASCPRQGQRPACWGV